METTQSTTAEKVLDSIERYEAEGFKVEDMRPNPTGSFTIRMTRGGDLHIWRTYPVH